MDNRGRCPAAPIDAPAGLKRCCTGDCFQGRRCPHAAAWPDEFLNGVIIGAMIVLVASMFVIALQ